MKPALLIAMREWDVESWKAEVSAHFPDRIVLATDGAGIFSGPAADLQPVHYALAWKPRPETLRLLPNLRTIFSLGAGVDHILSLPYLPDVPVVRSVVPDLSRRMSEYVAWQALDYLRRGREYRQLQRQHVWRELDQPAAEDVTVGLMGLGLMGARAAEVLLKLGFRVRGWSRSAKHLPEVETFAGMGALDRFLAGTDILVCLLPLTPETEGLIDLALLRKLRRNGRLGGPVFINAGRGRSHVEADLVAALQSGVLIGASIDVFEDEPLPADSPLWGLENVFITPHVAAISDPRSLVAEIARQIEAFEAGAPLMNCVERERGY